MKILIGSCWSRYKIRKGVKMNKTILLHTFAILITSVLHVNAFGVQVTWTLDNVVFEDGGTASGYFITDFDFSNSPYFITEFEITASGGNEAIFPEFIYDPINSSAYYESVGTDGRNFLSLTIVSNEPFIYYNNRLIGLTPYEELTTAGGTLLLNLVDYWDFNVECYNCNPYRLITSGSVVSSTSPPVVEIAEARMVSKNEIGVDLNVTIPSSDPVGGPWSVIFTANINGTPVTTKEFDLSDLLDPGDTDKEVRFDSGEEPRLIDLDDYEVPRFTTKQEFELTATLTSPSSYGIGTKQVEICLPVVIIHGWTGEQILASIPLRIYETLIDRLSDEDYTTDSSWYKTIWFERYRSQRLSPNEVGLWLDEIVIQAFDSTYASKVNIIGHSLGGLVGRYYATSFGRGNSVSRLIMVGTPNKGSSVFYIQSDRWSLDRATRKIDHSPLSQWVIPTYPALYGIDGEEMLPPIVNNFPDVPPSGDISYFSIFNTSLETPEKLLVQDYRGWFDVIDQQLLPALGDGVVTMESSALDYANNIPLRNVKSHAFLTTDPVVLDTIMQCLEQ